MLDCWHIYRKNIQLICMYGRLNEKIYHKLYTGSFTFFNKGKKDK
jgi:hypothetical protein